MLKPRFLPGQSTVWWEVAGDLFGFIEDTKSKAETQVFTDHGHRFARMSDRSREAHYPAVPVHRAEMETARHTLYQRA